MPNWVLFPTHTTCQSQPGVTRVTLYLLSLWHYTSGHHQRVHFNLTHSLCKMLKLNSIFSISGANVNCRNFCFVQQSKQCFRDLVHYGRSKCPGRNMWPLPEWGSASAIIREGTTVHCAFDRTTISYFCFVSWISLDFFVCVCLYFW